MMDAQLFYTTWAPDLAWLDYSLRSVRKYWVGDYKPLIIATTDCEGKIPSVANDIDSRVIFEPQLDDHHRGQLFIKMNADRYSDTSLILFMDSDCLLKQKCGACDFSVNGRPNVIMESYDTLMPRVIPQDQTCFQNYRNIIGRLLHVIPEHEYMRRHPFFFHRDTIQKTREKIEELNGRALIDLMKQYHSGFFSEFNFMAAYAHKYERDRYNWVMFKDRGPELVRQFHSYSQKPDEGDIGAEVAKILS